MTNRIRIIHLVELKNSIEALAKKLSNFFSELTNGAFQPQIELLWTCSCFQLTLLKVQIDFFKFSTVSEALKRKRNNKISILKFNIDRKSFEAFLSRKPKAFWEKFVITKLN